MSTVTTTAPMSKHSIRAKLEEMLIGDLLGPAGGPNEELTERKVRDRYVIGVLSPSRGNAEAALVEQEEEDEDTPLIPDELAEGGRDTADDGATDRDVPAASSRLPSTIGMTFCVDSEATKIKVTTSWGNYLRESREDRIDERTGRPILLWRRYPRGGANEVPLTVGSFGPIAPDHEFPDIYFRGNTRKRDGHWVVTVFLVNAQEEPKQKKDEAYLFQPVVTVEATDGRAIFRKRSTVGTNNDLEENMMAMLYRRHVEFAVGHGVSVHAEVSKEAFDHATLIRTEFIPRYEVPKTDYPTEKDADQNPAFGKLSGLVLDMKLLAEADAKKLPKMLGPLVTGYKEWIEGEARKLTDPAEGLAPFADAPQVAIQNCRSTLKRIEEGLQLLQQDAQAFEAFQFMNRAMWYQRTHSLFSEQIRNGKQVEYEKDIDLPHNRSWRPFQIAFILLNLPSVTKLDHKDRDTSPDAIADLLFFSTGGGKTESYLGLSAYTMGLRRLQGMIAGRVGDEGMAVLMRYTLRLLTIQQFQRATALICACETIRRKALENGDSRWGKTPFRIGLWVGRRTTPNRTEDAAEVIAQLRGNQYRGGGTGSPYQLTACPWCGSSIEAGQHLEAKKYPSDTGRTITYCGDRHGTCQFSRRQAPNEGLPVVVVDEEIYRLLPTLLIATVDKFAQMPWKGEVQMLFGQVDGKCERHGFRSPEIEDSSSHPKSKNGLPSARTLEHPPLRPPDLIIQDELHLISGPLGTLVGLYETAIDKLCTWEVNGKQVRPKVIASTATIKNADVQVRSLFLRTVSVFPPPGLDISDNFFSIQREPTEKDFGRIYLGICSPGRRLKAVLIQVYVSLLCSAQALYEQHGKDVDPWMTLVGYFNSMRELGGMRRLVDDSVYSRARKQDRRGLVRRFLNGEYLAELTSRMRSEDIPKTLDRLEAGFDPEIEVKRKESKGKEWKDLPQKPLDVLLATNMISVGVDVKRLGAMVVAGQPKATAEYIQATSRVGRSFPGLVLTVFNWSRPRDMSHYETFEHYHSSFYKHVEPLSVTPFSPGSLQRGLAGLLVSMVRMRGVEFNSNASASRITTSNPYVQEAIEAIAKRAEQIGLNGPVDGDFCRQTLKEKADLWQSEAQNTAGGRTLTYREPFGEGSERGTTISLLQSPGLENWGEFTCLNSLREVEPSIKFIISDGGLDGPETDEDEQPGATT